MPLNIQGADSAWKVEYTRTATTLDSISSPFRHEVGELYAIEVVVIWLECVCKVS